MLFVRCLSSITLFPLSVSLHYIYFFEGCNVFFLSNTQCLPYHLVKQSLHSWCIPLLHLTSLLISWITHLCLTFILSEQLFFLFFSRPMFSIFTMIVFTYLSSSVFISFIPTLYPPMPASPATLILILTCDASDIQSHPFRINPREKKKKTTNITAL